MPQRVGAQRLVAVSPAMLRCNQRLALRTSHALSVIKLLLGMIKLTGTRPGHHPQKQPDHAAWWMRLNISAPTARTALHQSSQGA